MKQRAGYKQTDAGVIPEDWEDSILSKLTTKVGRGITPTGGQRVYKSDGRPFIRSQNVGWGVLLLDDMAFIDDSTHVTFQDTEIKKGDVLLNITGSIGRCAVADERLEGGNVNENVCIIRPDTETLVPQFLNAYLLSTSGQRQIDSYQAGGNLQSLNLSQVRSIQMPLPSIPEQYAIATVLRDVDALLEGLDRLIAKKRDLKQAAMQQLLTGQTRLKGFNAEWQRIRLGDHVTFLSHGTNSRAELGSDGPVKYLHYGDIHASSFSLLAPVSLPSLPEIKAKGLDRLRDGDLVFVDASEDLTGVSKSVEIHNVVNYELVAGLHTIAARFDKSVLVDGFKAYLQFCPGFSDRLRSLAAGTKVYATNRSHIASIEIRLPSIEEQKAIASVFRDMDAEIESLVQRRDKTADLKQAMMQELLTGKTRLVAPQGSDSAHTIPTSSRGHNWEINEAVVIATLVKHFGSEAYPLGRKRYTKLSYLLHRHVEGKAEGYLKKAAGPYNPKTKYAGPERIAQKNRYICNHKGPKGHEGFIIADNIGQAEGYFMDWYGPDVIDWLGQFLFNKNDDLEVLTTVDMAVVELRAAGKEVDVAAVKNIIASHPEWEAKLDRPVFSDANIAGAIKNSQSLFGVKAAGGSHA